jgi:hypothetical protein
MPWMGAPVRDVDRAFASLAPSRTSALVIGDNAFFNSRSEHLATFWLLNEFSS